jgi:hypothetical protein
LFRLLRRRLRARCARSLDPAWLREGSWGAEGERFLQTFAQPHDERPRFAHTHVFAPGQDPLGHLRHLEELKGQLHAAVRRGNFSLILVLFAFTDPGGGIRVNWRRTRSGLGIVHHKEQAAHRKAGWKYGGWFQGLMSIRGQTLSPLSPSPSSRPNTVAAGKRGCFPSGGGPARAVRGNPARPQRRPLGIIASAGSQARAPRPAFERTPKPQTAGFHPEKGAPH